MKKAMLLIACVGMMSYGYCQDVKVNINNQEASTREECPYRINGICSTSDIGGVDVEFVAEGVENSGKYNIYAVFTNYNSSAVSVLYEIGNSFSNERSIYLEGTPTYNGTTGSIAIPVNGTKKVKIHSNGCCPSLTQSYQINGMIVRRIQ